MDSEPTRRVKKIKNTGEEPVSRANTIKPHKRESGAATGSGSTASAAKPSASSAVKPTASPKPTASTSPKPTASTQTPAASATLDLGQLIQTYMQSLPNGAIAQTVWGTGISRKENAARTNFSIPKTEAIGLILDATLFGTCKNGLALCSSGIYLRDSRNVSGAIGWANFPSAKIAANATTLGIGDYRFTTVDANYVAKLLVQIQSAIAQLAR